MAGNATARAASTSASAPRPRPWCRSASCASGSAAEDAPRKYGREANVRETSRRISPCTPVVPSLARPRGCSGMASPSSEHPFLSSSSSRPARVPPKSVPAWIRGAALVALGACLALGVEWTIVARHHRGSSSSAPTSPSSIVFEQGKACEVLCELTPLEIRRVARVVADRLDVATSRDLSNPLRAWIAGPSGVELWQPAKTDTLAYLDNTNDEKPARFARVTVADPRAGVVTELKVGPISESEEDADDADMTVDATASVPFSKRPTEPGADGEAAAATLDRTLAAIGEDVLVPLFGPVFPGFASYAGPEARGTAAPGMQNDALSPPGERYDVYAYSWYPPSRLTKLEAFWLHPVPLRVRVNATAPDPSEWTAVSVALCGTTYATASAARAAALAHAETAPPDTPLCVFQNVTGDLPWEVPDITNPGTEGAARIPLSLVVPDAHRRVRWGDWDLTVAGFRTSQGGPALFDVKFRGERVLYELSLQDAMAAYAGTAESEFFYADASWSLSMLSASLKPGVDCPADAHYLSAATWYNLREGGDAFADPAEATAFYPMCVFEFAEDHAIWRHMQNSRRPTVEGRTRNTLVVRGTATVGNYDYITSFAFREDGEIELSTMFAGYIESRHFDAAANPANEAQYSTILRRDLAGPLHSHIVSYKADFDIAGTRENAVAVTEAIVASSDDPSGAHKALAHRVVEHEGVGASTFVADPRAAGAWTIVDRTHGDATTNYRGYAVTLASFAAVQALPDDHPFTRAMPYSKYHLACTKQADDEYRATSPYVQYDADNAFVDPRNVDAYLADEESLLDVDVVAWISVGREHIVRQEDLPLVSNFGVHVSLQPWNFFEYNVAASSPPSAEAST
mmetsp:Transcript_5788/g.24164  ORF Transcript_5788/g.24164 Transcript_5788/m.24164 type:complete len:860 (+) Transcript_5788:1229-3808(+)